MIKRRFFLILILTFTLILLLGAFVIRGNLWYLTGQEISKIKNSNVDDEVIAKVGDTNITKKDLYIALALDKLRYEEQKKNIELFKQHGVEIQKPLDAYQMLNKIIDNELLYQEAKRLGCSVSYEEAKKFMENVRKTDNEVLMGNIKLSEENKKNVIDSINNNKQFIKGLGISESEYWQQIIKQYQKALSISKLRERILYQMPAEDRKIPEKVASYFDNYKKQLREKESDKVRINIKDLTITK
ncbi:SurA N-terminal domain-containing protein [Caldanaerobius polysaccharolyticus]|uniref:SurA N-terminal domain-containing protein n=1 Tax=Caldanaerobius polysaccharolyticus TaxID=44256 RepID=UPI000479ABF1|nr:SurA N-terminal domain-containing protein [Caldanaerobius polysaccharolyticus]